MLPDKSIIFFDFDNTITPFDVLDDLIKRFSINRDWRLLERSWKEGKIGSQACLEGQLKAVRITKKNLTRYLAKIKIDKYFSRLLALLRKQKAKAPIILSDNFSFIIKSILHHNGIKGMRVYSNRLKFAKDRLLPKFPLQNSTCKVCGHCKKKHLSRGKIRNRIIIYIGDGLSDVCPAKEADVVFAKGGLLDYLRKSKGKNYIAFKNLGDIYNYLRG